MFSLKSFENKFEEIHRVDSDIKILNNNLNLKFILTGNLEKIIIENNSKNPKRKDKLWEKTCFELFIAEKNKKEYIEFNFSTSGDWNAFIFEDYRKNQKEFYGISNVQISTEKSEEKIEINTDVIFSKNIIYRNIIIQLSAILQHKNSEKSFWAIMHSGLKPDFHQFDCFTEL